MDPDSFVPDFASLGGWAYFFIALVLFSSTPLPIFSTEVIVFLAGSMADPLVVGIVAGIATAIGELTTYVIGFGGERLISRKHKEGDVYKRATEFFERWGFWAVIVFALTPLPMDLIGLIAGGLKYDIKKFFGGALIGKIPRNIIIAYAGAGIIGFFF